MKLSRTALGIALLLVTSSCLWSCYMSTYAQQSSSYCPAAPAAAPTLLPSVNINERNFEYWRNYLQPKAQELSWQHIPWRTALWQAVVEAQAADSPIMLFLMNGHPLGTT